MMFVKGATFGILKPKMMFGAVQTEMWENIIFM